MIRWTQKKVLWRRKYKNTKATTNLSNQVYYTIGLNGTKLTYYFLLLVLLYIFCTTNQTVAAIVDLFVPLLLFVFALLFLFLKNNGDILAYLILISINLSETYKRWQMMCADINRFFYDHRFCRIYVPGPSYRFLWFGWISMYKEICVEHRHMYG